MNNSSFIESQFPVSKLSKESYKERKAGASQTLTGLGKWWGRKPLILVRATIIGLLMPQSDDPQKDQEIFLKIMTMDDEGLLRRKSKNLSTKEFYRKTPIDLFEKYFEEGKPGSPSELKEKFDRDLRKEMNIEVFKRLNYDDKLRYCDRPEQIDGPSEEAWEEINDHLNTSAENLQELVKELGERKFGHSPRVGDAFCGGGSIPFEAARIGCDAYGSDLNPAAAMLTWASINIVGGGKDVEEKIQNYLEQAYEKADKKITEWGIEHNEKGWRADAYLYCIEAKSPATDYWVPLIPDGVISKKNNICALLNPDHENKRYDIEIVSDASKKEMEVASKGTLQNSELVCPETGERFDISTIRGDNQVDGETVYGLRFWDNDDLVPRLGDTFQERLYCIRYIETIYKAKKSTNLRDGEGNILVKLKKGDIITHKEAAKSNNLQELLDEKRLKEYDRKHYVSPTKEDLKREEKVLNLLKERFSEWQNRGYIPSKKIERGYNTDQPVRERGWTYWHHLYTPRQLLTLGLFLKLSDPESKLLGTAINLYAAKISERYSRIMSWDSARDNASHVFTNQALNTYYSIACRSFYSIKTIPFISETYDIQTNTKIEPKDARNITQSSDYWITDPPYADAINYHELGDYFLAWYENEIPELFPSWYKDSKSALAVKGDGESFKNSMVECYRNFNEHMPENGAQVVMFTHQDSSVWADLALILWASGLQVTAAWTIQTETASAGIKKGNYVQGTVLMVLRKRTNEEVGFLSDIQADVEYEVVQQLDHMTEIDDEDDPNFGDADYQLAAYAAALRVLTQYKSIEDIDVEYELSKERGKDEPSEIEKIIESAVSVAMDHLVPTGFDEKYWRKLSPEERFYIKGLEVQEHGEYRTGVYQEMARGYGLKSYDEFLKSSRANETRLMTPIEFDRKELNKDSEFSTSLVRNVLFAVRETHKEQDPKAGRNWLKNELVDYWGQRKSVMQILGYIEKRCANLPAWKEDVTASRLLRGYMENDSV